MKRILLLSLMVILTSCAINQGYQAKSADEARAYAKRAVQSGVVHAGGEQELFLRKSAGKPATGKWDAQEIERFVAKWVANNPKRAELNLAATKGTISESERLHLIAALDMSEAAEQQRKAAAMQAVAAGVGKAVASPPTRGVSLAILENANVTGSIAETELKRSATGLPSTISLADWLLKALSVSSVCAPWAAAARVASLDCPINDTSSPFSSS